MKKKIAKVPIVKDEDPIVLSSVKKVFVKSSTESRIFI
jgi:hypothetical protein